MNGDWRRSRRGVYDGVGSIFRAVVDNDDLERGWVILLLDDVIEGASKNRRPFEGCDDDADLWFSGHGCPQPDVGSARLPSGRAPRAAAPSADNPTHRSPYHS